MNPSSPSSAIRVPVLSRRTAQLFYVTLRVKLPGEWPSEHATARLELEAFGVPVQLEEKQGVPGLWLSPHEAAASTVAAFFGVSIKPKTGVFVGLEADRHAALVALAAQTLAPFTAERTAYRAALDAEREAAVKRYFYEYGIEYGDYTCETIARLVAYRPLTSLERAEGRQAPEGQWVRHAILANGVAEAIRLLGSQVLDLTERPIIADPAIPARHPLREISADEVSWLVAATDRASALRQQEATAAANRKEAAAQLRQETEAARRALVEANEVLLFDASTVYGSAGNEMLHALGGRVSEQHGYVSIYTTQHARKIPGDTSTYALRNELLAAGYVFDTPSKEWRIAYSAENAEKTVAFLRTHDRRAWPATLGLARCWECGCYSSRLDSDGYCGC